MTEPVLPSHVYGAALAAGGELVARHANGASERLEVTRWLANSDGCDDLLLADVDGPVLDIGCGPGRHLRTLCDRGVEALGIDTSPTAVRIARRRGGEVVLGDVFTEQLPLAAWQTVLLLDGNLGIGGCPETLLRRVAELLHPSGQVVAEVAPPGTGLHRSRVRLELGLLVSEWFPWARVDAAHLAEPAGRAGLQLSEATHHAGRWFVALSAAGRPQPLALQSSSACD